MGNKGLNEFFSWKMNLSQLAFYLFFIFYLIMPEYFAIEFSASLPMLTASRCILIIVFLAVLFKNKIYLYIPTALILFFITILIVDIYHLFDNSSQSIKSIFSLLVEQLLLYIALYSLIRSKKMIIKALDLLVTTSGVMSVLACFETISGINLFYYLTTVSRDTLQASYERLGSLRAEASFGHPVFFAVYLVCIFPFSLYFYQSTKSRKYLFITILNVIALFCTGTRGGLIALLFVLLAYIYYNRDRLIKISVKSFRLFLYLIPIIVLILIAFPQVTDYVYNLVASTLSAFGMEMTVSSDFGVNAGGVISRIAQLTGLEWQRKHNALLFGFGPYAQTYGKISYFMNGIWQVSGTIDIGYLGYILQYGIIGGIGYAVLYLFVWIKALRKAKIEKNNNIYKTFVYFYVAYFISLFNSMGNQSMFIIFTSLFIIYIELDQKEKSEISMQNENDISSS